MSLGPHGGVEPPPGTQVTITCLLIRPAARNPVCPGVKRLFPLCHTCCSVITGLSAFYCLAATIGVLI